MNTRERGIRIISICATPVDETTSDIFAGYWIDDSGDFAERLSAAKRALPQDIRIWEHQLYMDHPALATSEAAGFKKLRSWAKGFYPEVEDVSAETAPCDRLKNQTGVPPGGTGPTQALPIAAAEYDPATGTYVGPDGKVYAQSNLTPDGGAHTWQDMLAPPGQ